jgi:hypothetical protein
LLSVLLNVIAAGAAELHWRFSFALGTSVNGFIGVRAICWSVDLAGTAKDRLRSIAFDPYQIKRHPKVHNREVSESLRDPLTDWSRLDFRK